jgi:hypothetical protein
MNVISARENNIIGTFLYKLVYHISSTMGCKSVCKYLKIALQTIKGMSIYWSISRDFVYA